MALSNLLISNYREASRKLKGNFKAVMAFANMRFSTVFFNSAVVEISSLLQQRSVHLAESKLWPQWMAFAGIAGISRPRITGTRC